MDEAEDMVILNEKHSSLREALKCGRALPFNRAKVSKLQWSGLKKNVIELNWLIKVQTSIQMRIYA